VLEEIFRNDEHCFQDNTLIDKIMTIAISLISHSTVFFFLLFFFLSLIVGYLLLIHTHYMHLNTAHDYINVLNYKLYAFNKRFLLSIQEMFSVLFFFFFFLRYLKDVTLYMCIAWNIFER